MEYLSYSQISKFKKCPFAYATGRIKKALPSVATDQGQNKHAIIEEYLRNGRQGELPKGFGPRLGAFLKYTLPEVSGLETKFDIDIFGYKFKGVIDAHMIDDDRAVVTDWKNHKSNYVEPDQLKLYALAVANANPDINYFDCYFYYLIPDFKEAFEFTRAEIDNYSGELLDIAGAMEQAEQRLEEYKNTLTAEQLKTMTDIDILIASGAYKCKPGPNCKSCNHVEQCPENKKFEIPVITSAEQAKELSQKLYAFEAFADTVKDRIKTYMLENSIDELPIDEENRYYIMYSAPQLKTGKIKTDKPKTEKPAKKKKEEKPIDITGEAIAEKSSVVENDVTAKAMTELNAAFQSAYPNTAETAAGLDMLSNAITGNNEPPQENPDSLDATAQLFQEAKPAEPAAVIVLSDKIVSVAQNGEVLQVEPKTHTTPYLPEAAEKPKRKRESTAERIARLAATAKHEEKK